MTGPLTEQERVRRARYADVPHDTLVEMYIDCFDDAAALSASLLAAQEALRQSAIVRDRYLDASTADEEGLQMAVDPNGMRHLWRLVDEAVEELGRKLALLGVSAEPLKDTDGATASQSPVAEEGQA